MSMMRASLPIRMRGWFFSMPWKMRSAATSGVVLDVLREAEVAQTIANEAR
jgi:hypothetical protein